MDMDIEHWRSEVNNFYLLHHQVFILKHNVETLSVGRGFCYSIYWLVVIFIFSKNLIYKISFKKQTFVFK